MKNIGYTYAEKAAIPREGSILQIPIEQIYAEKGAKSPLKHNESIRLSQSIKKYGISTPLIVTPTEVFPDFYRYCVLEVVEIWHAACLAGVERLPCVIAAAPLQSPEVAEICAQIRAGRLHIFEQAAALRHLGEKCGLSRAQIAKETGLSPSAVANKLRLCRFSTTEQQEILRAGLSERHARALLRLADPIKRRTVLQNIAREKPSVAATEAMIEHFLAENTPSDPLGDAKEAPESKEGWGAATSGEGQKPPPKRVEYAAEPSRASAVSIRKIPASKPQTGSICPKRFVLHTLEPLYNSIERTLTIFRKTGRDAEMQTQEGADEVLITIRIPHAT